MTVSDELPGMWEQADFDGGRDVIRLSAERSNHLLQQVVDLHTWLDVPARADYLNADGSVFVEGYEAHRICSCRRRFCLTRALFDEAGL